MPKEFCKCDICKTPRDLTIGEEFIVHFFYDMPLEKQREHIKGMVITVNDHCPDARQRALSITEGMLKDVCESDDTRH